MRIGLLPERLWGNSEHDGVDISGLGGMPGQLTPHEVAAWEESGTDTMRLVRKRKAVPTELNRPVLDGRPVDVLGHRNEILRGFRSAYALLAASRKTRSRPAAASRFRARLVSAFLRSSRRTVAFRRVIIPTLRDALDRPIVGSAVGRGRKRRKAEGRDSLRAGRPVEGRYPVARQPRFAPRGFTRRILDSLPEPSLSIVRRIVDRLDESGWRSPAWFIEASIASLPGSLRRGPSSRVASPSGSAGRDRLLAGAKAVGDRLDQLAVRGQGGASWIGLELEGRRAWSIRRAGLDLDAGVPGIVLFLAYLGAVTGHDVPGTLARRG